MEVGLGPAAVEVEDQTKPAVKLHSDKRATNPAAAAAVTLPKKSWIMGAACSRMPMPAVTLQNSTIHSSQNCGVLIALPAETLSVVTRLFAFTVEGSKPSGCQPSAGTRTMKAPKSLKKRETRP